MCPITYTHTQTVYEYQSGRAGLKKLRLSWKKEEEMKDERWNLKVIKRDITQVLCWLFVRVYSGKDCSSLYVCRTLCKCITFLKAKHILCRNREICSVSQGSENRITSFCSHSSGLAALASCSLHIIWAELLFSHTTIAWLVRKGFHLFARLQERGQTSMFLRSTM